MGDAGTARACMFYLITNVTKNAVALTRCLGTLAAAMRHVRTYQSVAADAGTAQRGAQHFLTRAINSMTGASEYSPQQAAASLLGFFPHPPPPSQAIADNTPTCLVILDALIDASADLHPPLASILVTAPLAHGQGALRLHAVPANTGGVNAEVSAACAWWWASSQGPFSEHAGPRSLTYSIAPSRAAGVLLCGRPHREQLRVAPPQ